MLVLPQVPAAAAVGCVLCKSHACVRVFRSVGRVCICSGCGGRCVASISFSVMIAVGVLDLCTPARSESDASVYEERLVLLRSVFGVGSIGARKLTCFPGVPCEGKGVRRLCTRRVFHFAAPRGTHPSCAHGANVALPSGGRAVGRLCCAVRLDHARRS
jgi:hypothetical protein